MGERSVFESGGHAPARLPRGRLALLGVLMLVLLSMVADRLLPAFGVRLARPTRWTLPPNLVAALDQYEFAWTLRTNRLGLRGRERALDRTPGVRRVVVLGDGRTAGVGVEADRTFAAHLEKFLDGVEVINCGRPGASTLTQARIFYHVALRFRPDLVVLCVYADDVVDMPAGEIEDVFEAGQRLPGLVERLWPNLAGAVGAAWQRFRYTRRREAHGLLERAEREARRRRIAESEILEWKRRVRRFPALLGAAEEGRFGGRLLRVSLFWPAWWAYALDLDGWHWAEKWGPLRRCLGAVRRESARRGVRFAVVFIPSPVQYSRAYHVFLARLGYRMSGAWRTGRSRFQVALGRWCGSHEVPFLDLTGDFRGDRSADALSSPYSGELTPAGHERIARRLGPWVKRLLRGPAGKEKGPP